MVLAKGDSISTESSDDSNYMAANSNLIRIIRKYKDIHFTIFFPPYFRGVPPNTIISYSSLQKYLVEQCVDCQNVTFFGFSDNDLITANAANYRDLRHYHSGVNLYILKQISRGRHMLTINNIRNYVTRVREKALNYNVKSDRKTMIPMAKKKERKQFRNTIKLNNKN
jgi:hypothetical protein